MNRSAPKGNILRVKQGYNPNSSSMGSVIFALPLSLAAASAGFTLASSLIFSFFLNSAPDRESDGDPAVKQAVDTDTPPDDNRTGSSRSRVGEGGS